MNARYRVIHFLPDPFSGARVPVAALVGDERGISVARANHLPGAQCLGSARAASAVEYILDALVDARALDTLPVAVGPQATLGPVTAVPIGVTDPVEWLRQHILPLGPTEQGLRERRGQRRQALGYRFFEQWSVGGLVHKHFRPQQEFAELVTMPNPGLEAISHWTGSVKSHLLLMEPIVPGRERHFGEVRAVFNRLAGYRVFLSEASEELKKRTEFCVYMLAGATAEKRRATRAAFDTLHARIVDTEVDRERDDLLAQIRVVGEGSTDQPPLRARAGMN